MNEVEHPARSFTRRASSRSVGKWMRKSGARLAPPRLKRRAGWEGKEKFLVSRRPKMCLGQATTRKLETNIRLYGLRLKGWIPWEWRCFQGESVKKKNNKGCHREKTHFGRIVWIINQWHEIHSLWDAFHGRCIRYQRVSYSFKPRISDAFDSTSTHRVLLRTRPSRPCCKKSRPTQALGRPLKEIEFCSFGNFVSEVRQCC